MPKWLRTLLVNGKTLEDFAVNPADKVGPKAVKFAEAPTAPAFAVAPVEHATESAAAAEIAEQVKEAAPPVDPAQAVVEATVSVTEPAPEVQAAEVAGAAALMDDDGEVASFDAVGIGIEVAGFDVDDSDDPSVKVLVDNDIGDIINEIAAMPLGDAEPASLLAA